MPAETKRPASTFDFTDKHPTLYRRQANQTSGQLASETTDEREVHLQLTHSVNYRDSEDLFVYTVLLQHVHDVATV